MKAKRGKCLALVAVLAMVVCAFAVAMPAGESDAVDGQTEIGSDFSKLTTKTDVAAGGKYYVTENVTVGTISATADKHATIVVAKGTLTLPSGDTAKYVDVYLAVDEKPSAYYNDLVFTGAQNGTYTAEADANGVREIKTTQTATTYGVHVKVGNVETWYPKGASVTANLNATNDCVEIVDGSAVVNGVYTATGATTTTTKETITATNVVAADASKPVVITVKTEFSAASGKFTVSGGDATSATPAVYTTGSIKIDKNSFVITAEDAAELVGVLNGYYTGGAVFAKAGTNGAGVDAVTAVYGAVDKPSAALSNSGGVTFYNATVSGVVIQESGADAVTMSMTNGTVKVDGGALSGIKNGTITLVSGAFTIADNAAETTAGDGTEPAVPYGATVTVMANASLKLTDATTVNGKLLVYGELTAETVYELTVEGAKDKAAELRAYTGSKINSNVAIVESGDYATVDISGAQKVEEKKGSTTSPATYVQTQVVELIGDYEITGESAVVVIYGELVIPEGFTLSITEGASVYVAGSVADVVIEGTLEIDEKSSFIVGYNVDEITKSPIKSVEVTGTVASEGTMIVDSDRFVVASGAVVGSAGTFVCAEMTVNAGGVLNLTGKADFTIWNAGSVVLDEVTIVGEESNEEAVSASVIHLTAADASVTVTEATLFASAAETTSTLTVDDLTTATGDAAVNTVVLKGIGTGTGTIVGTTFSGLTLVASGAYNSDATKDTRSIDLSGAVEAENSGAGEDAVLLTVTVGGVRTTVKSALALGEGVTLAFADAEAVTTNVLTVSGILDATDGEIDDGDEATIDVTGLISTKADIHDGEIVINAVYYTSGTGSSKVCCYTTLAAAILAEASTVEVLGDVVLKESATIPSGMTVKVDPAAGKLFVGTSADTSTRDVVLTFEDGAKTTGKGEVDVYGTLVVENLKDFKLTPKSDVVVTDNVSATYTNIYTALANAEAGDVVEVTSTEAVELDADITVAEGVTLKAGVDKTIKATKKITITVNGYIVSDNGIAEIESTGSALNITGVFVTAQGLTDAAAYYKAYGFAGAYYRTTDSTGTWDHITTLENAVKNAYGGIVYICGAVTVGDLNVVGVGNEAENIAVVTVCTGASLTAGTIYMENAIVGAPSAASITATLTGLNGSIAVKNVGCFAAEVIEDDAGVAELTVAGTVETFDSKTASSIAVASGTVVAVNNVTAPFDVTAVGSFTVAESATLQVENGSTMNAKDLSVAGTLEVENKASLSVTGTVYVTGTLTVDGAATGSSVGTVNAGIMFVGLAASSTGAAASVTAPEGAVDADVIYVMAGSTVSDGVVSGMKHTAYYVEGQERFTVYVPSASTMTIGSIDSRLAVVISGAKVTGWESSDATIGSVAEVKAVVKYDVYAISFVADYGFADIYLDGAKVASISGGKVIYIDPAEEDGNYILVEDGAHTVKYTLKSGYNGDKVTTSFNGKDFTGSFTIDSSLPFEDSSGEAVVYKVVLTGVTQAEPVVPEQQKTNNTLTDALLIVLVVLIAIMAIMVALKLMRS